MHNLPQHAAHPPRLDGPLHAILFFRYDVNRSESLLLFHDPRLPKNSRRAVLHLAARCGSNSGNHLSDGAISPGQSRLRRADAVLRDTTPRNFPPSVSREDRA